MPRKNFSFLKLSVILFSICFVFFGFTHNASAATYTWNPFLGGSGTELGYGIAIDTSGNVYVTGYSSATWGAPLLPYTLLDDAFVAKLDSTGALVWNTFLGGSGTDWGNAIAVDTSGNVYIAGQSNATWGSPLRVYTASSNDAFVTKLDTNGTFTWSTFLGGSGIDKGLGIALDTSGNIYVTGVSGNTWGTPLLAISGTNDFVAKIDTNGTIIWNTFLVSNGVSTGYAIAVDTSSNVYVTGNSNATWGSPKRSFTSSRDAFVIKLDTNGTLVWNTFLGGSGYDVGYAITVDTSSNVYVTGYSDQTWGTSPLLAYTSNKDVFVAKLDNTGALTWHTFLGGSGADYGQGITVDTSGNIYVGGFYGTTVDNAIAVKLNNAGSVVWSTFLGQGAGDRSYAIALDVVGNVYIGGFSFTTWGSPIRLYTTSDSDAFAAKLTSDGALVTISTSHNITATPGTNGTMDPSGATSVDDATNRTFTITPNPNYQIDNVLVDGTSVGKVSSYTFPNVTTDHTISASFSSITHHGASRSSTSTSSGQVPATDNPSQTSSETPTVTPTIITPPITITPDVTPTVIPPVITTPEPPVPTPSTSSGSSTYTLGTTTLKLGSKGPEVTELQRFLNNALNINLTLDGKLGKKTITYIKAWQKAHGLVADGIVGKRTRERMVGV